MEDISAEDISAEDISAEDFSAEDIFQGGSSKGIPWDPPLKYPLLKHLSLKFPPRNYIIGNHSSKSEHIVGLNVIFVIFSWRYIFC